MKILHRCVIQFGAILSSCWSPLLVNSSCDVTYVVMYVLGHNNDAAECYGVCEQACSSTISVSRDAYRVANQHRMPGCQGSSWVDQNVEGLAGF